MRAGHWLWTRGWLLTATMAPAIAWAQEPDVCERLGAAEAERSRCAREHYGAREYVTAARIFEELWRNTGAAKYLYNAAAAREAAGSDARALAHWLRYAAISEPSSTEQAEAEGRMSKLRARLITTTIEVTPAAALGPEAALSFERDLGGEVETFDYPVGLLSGAQPGVFTVHLEPGDVASARRPGLAGAGIQRRACLTQRGARGRRDCHDPACCAGAGTCRPGTSFQSTRRARTRH
jgi:hypothetical protein